MVIQFAKVISGRQKSSLAKKELIMLDNSRLGLVIILIRYFFMNATSSFVNLFKNAVSTLHYVKVKQYSWAEMHHNCVMLIYDPLK